MKAYPLYQRKRSFIYSILLTQCFYGHVLESLTLLITSLDQAPLTSQLIPRYLTRNLTYKKMRAKFCLTHLLHTSYAMLSSGLPWNMRRVTCIFRIRRVCIRRKYKWQVAYSTVSHEKALYNYFIPCLNLRKIYGNFRKLRKRFKHVIEELYTKKDLWKFWKIFGNLRKRLENFGNSSKVFSNVFMIF